MRRIDWNEALGNVCICLMIAGLLAIAGIALANIPY